MAQKPPGETVPRTPDGRPDLSGVWQALNTAAWDIQDHPAQLFPGLPARFAAPGGRGVVEGNEIPYQPWALALKNENFKNRATADPEAKCYLPGIPRATYMGYPFQIVQTPARITMLYEYVHAFRNIHLNSPHPKGPIEWWMGDSRGRWDGDTLVVDVVHFTDQTWFDRAGNFHSEQLHIVERFTPVSADRMRYEVTIEDPKVFTRPWKMTMPLYRRQEPYSQLLEFECYAFLYESQFNTRGAGQ
ncbi:MAG: hypothetical protein HYY76_13335 [Acidobacteria bacterium]|nr:hypothetical protein [Acidobacteriota bacterium]